MGRIVRLYELEWEDDGGADGYGREYLGFKGRAVASAKAWARQLVGTSDLRARSSVLVRSFDAELTKKGLLELLKGSSSHPGKGTDVICVVRARRCGSCTGCDAAEVAEMTYGAFPKCTAILLEVISAEDYRGELEGGRTRWP